MDLDRDYSWLDGFASMDDLNKNGSDESCDETSSSSGSSHTCSQSSEEDSSVENSPQQPVKLTERQLYSRLDFMENALRASHSREKQLHKDLKELQSTVQNLSTRNKLLTKEMEKMKTILAKMRESENELELENITGVDTVNLCCEVCQVKANTMANLKEHLAGNKHRKQQENLERETKIRQREEVKCTNRGQSNAESNVQSQQRYGGSKKGYCFGIRKQTQGQGRDSPESFRGRDKYQYRSNTRGKTDSNEHFRGDDKYQYRSNTRENSNSDEYFHGRDKSHYPSNSRKKNTNSNERFRGDDKYKYRSNSRKKNTNSNERFRGDDKYHYPSNSRKRNTNSNERFCGDDKYKYRSNSRENTDSDELGPEEYVRYDDA